MKEVALRPFPWPARALLAIASDIDNSTFDGFIRIHEFLNTGRSTPFGDGLGLEIGDSFWMYSVHPRTDDAFTYFDGVSSRPGPHAEAMRALMQAGYLDTLHTWGNFSERGGFVRSLAERAAEELDRHRIHPPVWVNHDDAAYNRQRLGGPGMGHRRESDAFHADLTFALGVRFVWENLLTGIVGQERRLSPFELVDTETVRSAILRPLLYRFRGDVSASWMGNRVLSPRPPFPDIDPRVRSFTRYGFWQYATADYLPLLLAPEALDGLIATGGVSIVYVHLGQQRSGSQFPLGPASVAAFEMLAARVHSGHLCVTTVSRLLRFVQVRNNLRWTAKVAGSAARIAVDNVRDGGIELWPATAETLMGIAFYVPDATRAEIVGPDGPLPVAAYPPDHTGRPSVGIPWRPLVYPL